MECIANAIDNKYLCKANSKEIEGYNGIDEDEWKNQWYNLGSQFQITINDDIIKEITLCIYSLAQKQFMMIKNHIKEQLNLELIVKQGNCFINYRRKKR